MKSYCGGLQELANALSNGAIPPLRPPLPQDWGVRNRNPKLQSLLSQERLKLRNANLGEKGAWAYPETAQIF